MTSALAGYFLAPDAYGDPHIWRDGDHFPRPVLAAHTLRDDPDLWAALVALVEVRP